VTSSPEERVPIVQSPDKYSVIVLGGAGKRSAYIPSFGNTLSVTRVLQRADGTPARSVHDFRQA